MKSLPYFLIVMIASINVGYQLATVGAKDETENMEKLLGVCEVQRDYLIKNCHSCTKGLDEMISF